eukprot:269153_1
MNTDVNEILKRCPCFNLKMKKKQEAGYKDKGLRTQQYALDFNEITYMDCYGPLKDGDNQKNWVISMIDYFSVFIESDLLLPLYEISALGIVKWILFRWIWRHGCPLQITCDNGSIFVGYINMIFYYIFGIKKFKMLSYTPWGSGLIENSMKNINHIFRLEDMRREVNGFRKLINEGMIDNELRIIVRSAELVNNHTVKYTGYKPIEINHAVKSPFILDIALRLERNNL